VHSIRNGDLERGLSVLRDVLNRHTAVRIYRLQQQLYRPETALPVTSDLSGLRTRREQPQNEEPERKVT
jgi:hypothetical protein